MDNKLIPILGGIGLLIVLILVVVLVFFATYNNFVSLEQNVNTKWANVETQYQRRVDLIPNLVSTVRGATDYEGNLLTDLVELRSQWQTQPEARVDTANQIESTISKLLLITENYPQLQAVQGFQDLRTDLAGTENRIAFARTEYNEAVKSYNTSIKSMPGVFVASMFGFSEKQFFEAEKGAEIVPDVDFS